MKYTKTELGQQAFKQRSTSITARQRSLFILFDGQKTADQVLAATAGLGATLWTWVIWPRWRRCPARLQPMGKPPRASPRR